MAKFLAVYTGTPRATPPDLDPAAMAKGMQEWGAWMERHAAIVLDPGGPLGRTKKVSKAGVEDVRNNMSGYTILEADSIEAAAALFKDHPHFSIFPGDGIEIMPVMPIPTAP